MSRIFLFGNARDDYAQMPVNPDAWAKYQRNAIRYLRATGASPETMSTLEHLPFSCVEIYAPDRFGDPEPTGDHLLTLRIPVEVFVQIEREHGSWPNRIAEQIPQIAYALGKVGCKTVRVVAEVELDAENESLEIIQGAELNTTSETVEHALNQARTLIVSHGAPAALDRVHTVFHAYLKAACEKAQLPLRKDKPGIVELLGLLKRHGVFVFEPELETLVTQTLRGAQKSVDALETFRNEYSLAHPQEMLPEPEALLVINLTQAILRYIDTRLQK
jgi:hypothetical protein